MEAAQDSDISQFWIDNRPLFPNYLQIESSVYTSDIIERVFSLADSTVEKRQARLSSDTVNGLLLLHSNLWWTVRLGFALYVHESLLALTPHVYF